MEENGPQIRCTCTGTFQTQTQGHVARQSWIGHPPHTHPTLQEEEWGWGGREGCLEEGTLGSALRAKEILRVHRADGKEAWGVLALLELGKVKKLDWSLRSAQRNLNLTHGQWTTGREPVRSVARRSSCHPGSEMGPSWHKAKGLHGKRVRFRIFPTRRLCPPPQCRY